jgi:UDP-N-acetylglucosamine 1-carboxyvinyltransferase
MLYNSSVFLAKNQAMSNFVINGGKKLKGEIVVGSGKNAPIAIIAAALLIRDCVLIKDIVHAEEIYRMLEILESIGVKCVWKDKNSLEINATGRLEVDKINKAVCKKIRASLLLFGALAAREKRFRIYKTGGCKLGHRTIRPHVFALKQLGINIASKAKYYDITVEKLAGNDVVMYESSDTATENAVLAAVLASGKTTIKFASANYMVQDLCYFLIQAGAKIEGVGTTTLKITGVKSLKQKKPYFLSPDPVDAMAWISLACSTGSELLIKKCPMDFLELELLKLSVMGQKFEIKNKRKAKNGKTIIADIQIFPSELSSLPDKLYGRPYPGLNIDNVPLFLPVVLKAKGKTLIHDWCYENRAIYYEELKKMGAKILLLDPHRVLVEGGNKLRPNKLVCPPAIRPGMAILIAMLSTPGKSVLVHCYPLERAYDNLVQKLQSVGADIKRVN